MESMRQLVADQKPMCYVTWSYILREEETEVTRDQERSMLLMINTMAKLDQIGLL
jgi:hypothetical protein